ncbi:GNAT family N-acetyltransferase [Cognatishimia sp. F0-27]|uniref:GNAT family N-acetyltransferase n=1 Tax=Cognatishimia sp. F0-27 TaxID=2816855 RepID=UPI001D0C2C78|nr:GNAT family N-acetyltransferase [Cognatishimia sp. F0-27]MCC1494666.1 GNAT family N-acetyltransferase [Cognatishimia sp. F0-27]
MIIKLDHNAIPRLVPLLRSVQAVHCHARPHQFHDGATDSAFAAFFADRLEQGALILGFERDNALLGYALVQVQDRAADAFRHAERLALIDQISVAEAHRGKGIGTALIRAVEARLPELGCTGWTALYWTFNAASARLFTRAGAERAVVRVSKALGPGHPS